MNEWQHLWTIISDQPHPAKMSFWYRSHRSVKKPNAMNTVQTEMLANRLAVQESFVALLRLMSNPHQPHPEQIMYDSHIMPPPPILTHLWDTVAYKCVPSHWSIMKSLRIQHHLWADPHIFNMKNICILEHSLHSLIADAVNLKS